MTTRFDTCLQFVLAREGGFVNDPHDRGGATNKGITQAVYDLWRKEHGLEPRSVAEIDDEEVATIYRAKYWESSRCGTLPEPIDLFVFDSAVQHGPRKAIQFLQRSMGVTDTGYFGPLTMTALRRETEAGEVRMLAQACMAHRREFYDAIVKYDPTQGRFANGWANRMEALERAMA